MKQAPLAAAVAIAALAGGAGMASAQAFSLGEVYVKGFGGATWPSNFDTTLREGGEQIARPSFDYDTGYALGAAVGAAFTPNISMEIEYAYRSADVTITDRDDDDESGRANGDTSANAFMFNALYVFDGMGATGAIQPYLGGGIGAAKVETSASGQNFDSDTLLAYQLIGGVGYQFSPNVSLYAEARWFQTESGKFDGPGGDNFNGEFETFDLLVGIRYVFSPAM
jgi:opacity protein-like surface antigen